MVTTRTWFGSVSLQKLYILSFAFLKWHLTNFALLPCSTKAQPYRTEVFFMSFRNLSNLSNCMQTTLIGYWNPWASFFQKWQCCCKTMPHILNINLICLRSCAVFTLGNTHFTRQKKRSAQGSFVKTSRCGSKCHSKACLLLLSSVFSIVNLRKFKSLPQTVSQCKKVGRIVQWNIALYLNFVVLWNS